MRPAESCRRLWAALCLLCLLACLPAGCTAAEDPAPAETTPSAAEAPPPGDGEDRPMGDAELIVGDRRFAVTLYDTPAAQALRQRLPMTLSMRELGGNEKYFYLPYSLPAAAAVPAGIEAGDLMLYGSDCLVLFYDSFTTTYAYTPLGRVEDPAELAQALGAGDVQITLGLG